jgi:hypothetical protein
MLDTRSWTRAEVSARETVWSAGTAAFGAARAVEYPRRAERIANWAKKRISVEDGWYSWLTGWAGEMARKSLVDELIKRLLRVWLWIYTRCYITSAE